VASLFFNLAATKAFQLILNLTHLSRAHFIILGLTLHEAICEIKSTEIVNSSSIHELLKAIQLGMSKG
jgi:hypothetical protein